MLWGREFIRLFSISQNLWIRPHASCTRSGSNTSEGGSIGRLLDRTRVISPGEGLANSAIGEAK